MIAPGPSGCDQSAGPRTRLDRIRHRRHHDIHGARRDPAQDLDGVRAVQGREDQIDQSAPAGEPAGQGVAPVARTCTGPGAAAPLRAWRRRHRVGR